MSEQQDNNITKHNERINGTWKSWGHHVLETIERFENRIEKLEKQQHKCELDYKTELTAIKTKAGIIGAIAGIVGSIVMGITVSVAGKYIFINMFEDEIKKETEKQIEDHSHNTYRPYNLYEFLNNKRG